MKIYLATSWKNEEYYNVLSCLRTYGHEVYDFRDEGFSWAEIDPYWQNWIDEPKKYLSALEHPRTKAAYERDFNALQQCDLCFLLLPAGVSAALEAGWAKGAGKQLVVCISSLEEKNIDLMLKMADLITDNLYEALDYIGANHV